MTTIYVSDDDQRDDQEIIKEYKANLKASRELHRDKTKQFKLTKNPNGATSGRLFNWAFKDPSDQIKLDFEESINAIQEYMPA
jgi:hypothetical protein